MVVRKSGAATSEAFLAAIVTLEVVTAVGLGCFY